MVEKLNPGFMNEFAKMRKAKKEALELKKKNGEEIKARDTHFFNNLEKFQEIEKKYNIKFPSSLINFELKYGFTELHDIICTL